MTRYKLQVQDGDTQPLLWRDVKNEFDHVIEFQKEPDARAKLEELFPILVKLERYAAGPKRTRVVIVNPYQDVDDEKDK